MIRSCKVSMSGLDYNTKGGFIEFVDTAPRGNDVDYPLEQDPICSKYRPHFYHFCVHNKDRVSHELKKDELIFEVIRRPTSNKLSAIREKMSPEE